QGVLLLPLLDSSGGYSVQDVEGLGPVKATLVTSSIARQDGATLHNTKRDTRNIVITLGFEADGITNTVADLRSNLYRFFMSKSEVTIGLYRDGNLWATTLAVVESCDPAMFSADPQVVISLLCMDPDLYAPDITDIDSFTVNNTSTQTIAYEGTTETGIEF